MLPLAYMEEKDNSEIQEQPAASSAEIERPFVKNVEDFMTKFIHSVGGSRVDEIIKDASDSENADYYFPNENVVIELKCLEKDLFSDEDFERNKRLIDKWLEEGVLNKVDIIPIFLGRKSLPKAISDEIVKLCSRTFKKIIEKANKQLKETKDKIGSEDTERILMVCNDGNFFLDNAQLFGLVTNIMGRREEIKIEGLVYFTVNQASIIPNSDLDWGLWIPAYGDTAKDELSNFVNELGRKFHEFYCKEFNIPVTEHKEYSDSVEGMEAINAMRYIPKDVIYKKPQ